MKKSIIGVVALAVVAVVLSSCVYVDGKRVSWGSSLEGDGNLITKSVALPDYHRVTTSRGVVVELVDTTSTQLTVTADQNIMPYVQVTCNGGDLQATIDRAVKRVGDCTVIVTLPKNSHIEHLQASSDGEIIVRSPLSIDGKLGINTSSAAEISGEIYSSEVTIAAASASEVDLTLTCGSITVSAASAANVELHGSASAGQFMTASAAEIDAEEFEVTILEVLAASAGSASVFCTQTLSASASSGGDIEYRGREGCVVHRTVSSGGSVELND